MSTLTVATVQFSLRCESSLAGFLQHVEAVVRKAADKGADVVLLPELASTGLLGAVDDHRVTTESVSSDYWNVLPGFTQSIVDGYLAMARTYDIVVAGGSHNRLESEGVLRNTAFVVHPDGRVDAQDKIHLTPQEHDLGIRGGDRLMTTRLGPFTPDC